jgi:lycopene cyclase domain-containing protein
VNSYPMLTLAAMAVAVAVDTIGLRTHLLRTRAFWASLAIMFSFQVFVDGWLTRSTGTIVRHLSGLRIGFNTPIEDFGFAFALILLTLSVWHALGRRTAPTSRR